jgi:3-hydroxymyristoyl/3-hydroxydecanoyl-(acyl carrier protein) dehydratase
MTASIHDVTGAAGRGREDLDVVERRATGDTIEVVLRAPPDLVYFTGHFPGDPLLPGVVQLNDVALAEVERAWPDLGPLERIQRLKFVRAIRPGDPFTLRLERRARPGQVALTILSGDEALCTSAVLSFGEATGYRLQATGERPHPSPPSQGGAPLDGSETPREHARPEACSLKPVASSSFRPCAVIPTFDDVATLAGVVEGVRAFVADVIVVDDGSAADALEAAGELERGGRARVVRRHRNGGKGAAVVDGLQLAHELGFTHALQVDADGQHDLRDVPRFLAAARAHPRAFVTGRPVFDRSAPQSRRAARLVSVFWVTLETAGRAIRDPLCGFRVYPVAATLAARPRARRMGHDPEVAVRLCWAGAPVINLDTRIRYLPGGASHYDLVWDNLEMVRTHTRLCLEAAPRLLWRWTRRGRQ